MLTVLILVVLLVVTVVFRNQLFESLGFLVIIGLSLFYCAIFILAISWPLILLWLLWHFGSLLLATH